MSIYYKAGLVATLLSFSSYSFSESEKPNYDSQSTELVMPIVSIDKSEWYENVRLKLNFFTGRFSVVSADPISTIELVVPIDNPVKSTSDDIFFDFSTSSEGDVFTIFGDNNIVMGAPKGMALTSGNGKDENISIGNFTFSKDIEFKISVDLSDFDHSIIFWQGSTEVVTLKFKNQKISFGSFSSHWRDTSWEGGTEDNEILITLSGGLAKAFINGKLLSSTKVEFSSLDRVEFGGINRESGEEDYIYSISLKGS